MSLSAAASRWLRMEIWQRRAIVFMTAATAAVYAIGVLWTAGIHHSFVKGDARSYFAFLPSIVFDRDLDLRNQFGVLKPEGDTEYPFGISHTGVANTPFPVAPALLWLPGYVAGVAVDRTMAPLIGETEPLGYGVGSALGAAIWSILLVGIGIELTRRLVQHAVGADTAFAGAVLSWIATSALYYTAISPLYSHAPAIFAVSFMLWSTWQAAHAPDRAGWWIASGIGAGVIVAVRLQDAALIVIPAVVLLMTVARADPQHRRPGVVLIWIAAAAAAYLPEAFARYRLEGTLLPLGVDTLRPLRVEEMIGILFSTGYRGWISWTPIVLPALVGLVMLARHGTEPAARWMAWSGLVGIAGMFLLDAVHPFGAGAAFGGRRYVSATPLLALGLATLLGPAASLRVRKFTWVVFPALAVWNVCVLLSYELLTLRHGIYPTLVQAVRYALGGGIS